METFKVIYIIKILGPDEEEEDEMGEEEEEEEGDHLDLEESGEGEE